MNIDKLSIENVTVFDDFKLNVCNGVNIIIGENGTGKTHVLKFIYSICKNISRSDKDLDGIAEQFFKVGLEKLIRSSEKKCAKVHLSLSHNNVNFKIEKKRR